MSDIVVKLYDLYNIKIEFTNNADAVGIRRNLSEWFSKFSPNYRFNPRFKRRVWDGKIRFYDRKNSVLPIGLLYELKKFADTYDLTLNIDNTILTNNFKNISSSEIKEFIYEFVNKLKLPFKPHNYQLQYFTKFVQNNILLMESPTASGKSLIIYMCICYILNIIEDKQILLIVPTIQLVEQMYKDFKDYGMNVEKYCARIYSGSENQQDKLNTNKKIIISTWQSLYKLDKSEFKNIGMICGDEIHQFGAKEAKSVITNCNNAVYRLGTTGTLKSNDICSSWTIIGMFNKPIKYVTTGDLIEKGFISDFDINVINLIYNQETCKLAKKLSYQEEIDFLSLQQEKIEFIKKLVKKINKKNENTLLLFKSIEYGKNLKEQLSKIIKDVYYVDGSIKMKDRENIRIQMESKTGQVAVCSVATFATGINIKNLHNVILVNSTKSEITILQSIGRVLRLHKSKTKAKIWDIVDNLKYGKNLNYSLKHFYERKMYYDNNGFKIKYFDIKF